MREMWPYAVEIGDAYGIDPVTILTLKPCGRPAGAVMLRGIITLV